RHGGVGVPIVRTCTQRDRYRECRAHHPGLSHPLLLEESCPAGSCGVRCTAAAGAEFTDTTVRFADQPRLTQTYGARPPGDVTARTGGPIGPQPLNIAGDGNSGPGDAESAVEEGR